MMFKNQIPPAGGSPVLTASNMARVIDFLTDRRFDDHPDVREMTFRAYHFLCKRCYLALINHIADPMEFR